MYNRFPALSHGIAREKKQKIMCNFHWPEKLYINQNLITLIVFYIGVAYAEQKGLCYLSCASWFLFMFSSISVMVTLSFYTYNYCRNKCKREK